MYCIVSYSLLYLYNLLSYLRYLHMLLFLF